MATLNDLAFLLALLRYSGGRVEGRKRIQKLVYLLIKEHNIPFTFKFVPYFYGPYSSELSIFLETLVGLGLVEEEGETISPRVIKFNYSLTKKGEKVLERALEQVDRAHILNLKKFIEETMTMDTYELVNRAKMV